MKMHRYSPARDRSKITSLEIAYWIACGVLALAPALALASLAWFPIN
jgi:hypothetical protein